MQNIEAIRISHESFRTIKKNKMTGIIYVVGYKREQLSLSFLM